MTTTRTNIAQRALRSLATITLLLLFGAGCGDDSGTGPAGQTCPVSLGPLVSYPFSGNADDVSGNGNHGTVQGATLVMDRFGNPASAYAFDGVADAISIGPGGQAPFPITISLWFNAGDVRFAQIFSNDDTNDAANRWGIGMLVGATGSIGASTYEGFSAPWNRTTYWASGDNLYAPNEWHHLAIVFNANDDRVVYLDGTVHGGVYSGSGSGMTYGGGNGLIGRMHGNSLPKFQFLGSLDDIKVFDQALTAAEVAQLFSLANGCS